MNRQLADRVELFCKNRLLMQQGFSWEYPAMNGLVAMLYTVYNRPLDIDLIRSCRRVMRPRLAEQGFLEGPGIIAASAMISLADDPVEAYHNTNKLYNMFQAKGFEPSLYVLLASINIAKHHVDGEFSHMVEKADVVYKYLLTIYPIEEFGVHQIYKETLAVTFSDTDGEHYTQMAKSCYQSLRPKMPSDNAAYILTDTLMVNSQDLEASIKWALRINELLSERGFEWKEDFQYAILGVLAALGERKTVIIEEILEVIEYLELHIDTTDIHLMKDHLLTYACLLLEITHIENMPEITKEQVENIFVDLNIAMLVNMVEEAPYIG